jgi:formate dehydrogenase assembly factor FdhD
VVKVYLAAVKRGDRESAIAELASPPTGPLPEEGVVDGSTDIRAIEVHGTGDVVTVDVDLATAAGPYSAQYTVRRSPTGAALISSQTIVKS